MKSLLPICLLLLLCSKVNAQGPPPQFITGGTMYYTYQGAFNGEHVYRVTVQCYATCMESGKLPNVITVSIYDRLTHEFIKKVSPTRGSSSQSGITADSLNNCLVNPPTACNAYNYYSFDVSLPPSANGYLLSCIPGYRDESISNLSESAMVLATYTAEIPGGAAAANSTFAIAGDDVVASCPNSKFSYSFGATDYDGDELRYYLSGAYEAGLNSDRYIDASAPPPFQSVIYSANFSSSRPLGANVIVDEKSGLMTGLAPGVGSYLVTICVGEYRNGVLIATQRKEVQIDIVPCEITAASLLPEYLLCGESRTLQLANLSSSLRVQEHYWQISSSDGTILYTQTTPTISYTFADTGIYYIKLAINRRLDCRDSTTSIARVYPGIKSDFTVSGTCISSVTSFTNKTSVEFGELNYWKWDFGDYVYGTAYSSTDVTRDFNPVYQYKSSGPRTVQLIVGTTIGCRDTLRKKIEVLPRPQIIMVTLRSVLACARDTTQLKAYAPLGGTFSWSPQVNMADSDSATAKVAPPVTTVYRVLLRDDNGCENTDSVSVRVTDKVLLEAMNDTTICQGDAIQLKLTSNGQTFSWTNVNPANTALRNPLTVVDTTTLYEVTASIGSCSSQDSVLVTTVPFPKVNAGADILFCNETTAQLSGSTNGSSFAWAFSPTLNQTDILNPTARPVVTTNYVLTAYDTIGCAKPASDTVTVKILPPLKPFAGNDTAVVVGEPLRLNASGGVRYEWSPATALSAINIPNPVAVYNTASEGRRYKVKIWNEGGCVDSAYINIKVYATSPTVYVPSAFTPNGDGKNDKLRPLAVGISQIEHFYIYNRFGQLVFQTKKNGEGWDGRVGGKMQNTGVFTWVVQGMGFNGKRYSQQGFVMLLQ